MMTVLCTQMFAFPSSATLAVQFCHNVLFLFAVFTLVRHTYYAEHRNSMALSELHQFPAFKADHQHNMNPQRDHLVDETMKNRIFHLYIIEDLTLSKLRLKMKNMFDFDRTRNEYQKLLHDWRFEKNRANEDWRSLKRKIGARAAIDKKSALYLNRKLLPDQRVNKEFGRKELFMGATEEFKVNQEPMPATPPGFLICTPDAHDCHNYVFNNIPILSFVEIARNFAGSVLRFDSTEMTLVPFFATSATQESHTDLLSSILPPSAATGLGLDRIDRLGPIELVNLVTYVISNNLPGKADSRAVYSRLKASGILDLLSSLASVDTSTTKALLEGIFRLAMKALDTLIVKELLRMKVNSNGHQIVYDGIVGTFDALQFACMNGNIKLAQALLEAGATVQEDEHGWKRSILTIAIIGNYGEPYYFYEIVEDRAFNTVGNYEIEDNEEDDVCSYAYDNVNNEHDEEFEGNDCYCDYHSIQRNDLDFIELAESLMRAGAKVVFRVDDDKKDLEGWDEYSACMPDAFRFCDSPLTAAAKYKRQYLVDKFLSLGADANLTAVRGDSALQQCLFSVEEAMGGYGKGGSDEWTLPELQAWMLARAGFKTLGCENITGIAKTLLRAKANPDKLYNYPDDRNPSLDDRYDAWYDATPLNIAILCGFEDLVESFLSSGVKPNQSCLEYAIYGGNRSILERILDTDAPLSYNSLRAATELPQHGFLALITAKRTTPLSRTMAVIEALRSDAAENFLDFQNFDPSLLHAHLALLEKAVGHCCFTSTGRTVLFFKLLNSQRALRVLHLPNIPSVLDSIAQAGATELWESLTSMVENHFVPPTAWLDATAAAAVPLKLASHRPIINSYRAYRRYQKPVESLPTPLHKAVEKGDITQVKRILEQQADPNFVPTGTSSHTPLQIAARNGGKEICRLLLEYGADVNARPRPDSGATALQFAAIGGYLGIAVLFLEYQVDLDAVGAQLNGRTALEGAAEHGRIDMLKMLLNAGVDVYGRGQIQYEHALDFASNNGHHAARQMLEEHHSPVEL